MQKSLTRRKFIENATVATVGVSILPSLVSFKRFGKSTVNLGFIGLGRQSMFLLKGFAGINGVKVIAGCDVYGVKRERFKQKATQYNKANSEKIDVQVFERYQDLLGVKDIDAVIIAVPDHSHAMIAIAACKAGMDVYLEKPLTFTIKEGRTLCDVVRKENRILAVGSQQRSDPNFQHAVKLVQDGAIGDLVKVNAHVGPPPTPYDLPKEEIPSDLNWDLWLANLNPPVHYHHYLNPPISLDPEKNEDYWAKWRYYKGTGGGYTADWGAHMFDIAQWGMGMDKKGPVEVSPINKEYLLFKYPNGVIMTSEPFDEKETLGVKFFGTKGWIEVSRGHYLASDEKWMPKEKGDTKGPYETKASHQANFIEAIKNGSEPAVPVEIGHSTATTCNLGNIAFELQRKLKWDWQKEQFIDDKDGEASKRLHYEYREGWSLI